MTFVISPCTQRRLMCLASAKYDIRSAHYTLLYLVCTYLLTYLHIIHTCTPLVISNQLCTIYLVIWKSGDENGIRSFDESGFYCNSGMAEKYGHI